MTTPERPSTRAGRVVAFGAVALVFVLGGGYAATRTNAFQGGPEGSTDASSPRTTPPPVTTPDVLAPTRRPAAQTSPPPSDVSAPNPVVAAPPTLPTPARADADNPWVLIRPPPTPVRLGYAVAPGASDVTGFRPSANVRSPSDAYFIQQHEVTWAAMDQHEEFLNAPGFLLPDGVPTSPAQRANLPVTGLSQALAQRYCAVTLGGSLPTEEQWEYAARGASLRPHPWGDTALRLGSRDTWAWSTRAPLVQPVLAATQDVTPGQDSDRIFGLAGNAMEWTIDVFRDDESGREAAWARGEQRVNFAVRGLPLGSSRPRVLPTMSAVPREAYCGDGACDAAQRQLWQRVGFRCVHRVAR